MGGVILEHQHAAVMMAFNSGYSTHSLNELTREPGAALDDVDMVDVFLYAICIVICFPQVRTDSKSIAVLRRHFELSLLSFCSTHFFTSQNHQVKRHRR